MTQFYNIAQCYINLIFLKIFYANLYTSKKIALDLINVIPAFKDRDKVNFQAVYAKSSRFSSGIELSIDSTLTYVTETVSTGAHDVKLCAKPSDPGDLHNHWRITITLHPLLQCKHMYSWTRHVKVR